MRVLAIDPGNTQSAWCLFCPSGIITEKCDNKLLLDDLRAPRWTVDLLAVEMIASYGMAVGKEVFDTCLWIGRYIEAWEAKGGRTKLVYRKDVKLHHCHTVKASDANIRAAIIDRYGPGKEVAIGKKKNPGPLFGIKGDAWAALAIALTVVDEGG